MKTKPSFGARAKESVRKAIVSLKHRPQTIPLLMLVVTFLFYSMHLTTISNTTAKIQGPNMGLCGFLVMLFSILSMVAFSNSFPRRKPVNKAMLTVMFLMFGIIIFADINYLRTILAALNRELNPIVVTDATAYISQAQSYLKTHIILMAVSIALIVLMPVYAKQIRKIKTSIEVEESGDMEQIDISGEN